MEIVSSKLFYVLFFLQKVKFYLKNQNFKQKICSINNGDCPGVSKNWTIAGIIFKHYLNDYVNPLKS